MTIYERVRNLREDKDWTPQRIADMLYINRRTYSSYETGVRTMSPEILIRLAGIHGVSVDYLPGLTDAQTPL
jgi:Helix-turn-helix.